MSEDQTEGTAEEFAEKSAQTPQDILREKQRELSGALNKNYELTDLAAFLSRNPQVRESDNVTVSLSASTRWDVDLEPGGVQNPAILMSFKADRIEDEKKSAANCDIRFSYDQTYHVTQQGFGDKEPEEKTLKNGGAVRNRVYKWIRYIEETDDLPDILDAVQTQIQTSLENMVRRPEYAKHEGE